MIISILPLLIVSVFSQECVYPNGTNIDAFEEQLNSQFRILGGTRIPIHEAPYYAEIIVYGIGVCGGSIVSQRTILTAGHCLVDTPLSVLMVGVGSSHSLRGYMYRADSFLIHPEFHKAAYMSSDVGLIYLKEKVTFSKTIKIVRLASYPNSPREGLNVSVVGLGYMQEMSLDRPEQLLRIFLPVVRTQICRNFMESVNRQYDGTQFCMGVLNKGNLDACAGDSGGPVVSVEDGTQVGVVSWGRGCGRLGKPGVYSNIPALYNWISEHIKQ